MKCVTAMNKNNYSWWPYIRKIVRLYPERSQIPLTGVAFREYMDVKRAIEATEAMPDGNVRMQLIRMIHLDKAFTLTGAALQIPCDRATAARWQRRFFEEVARNRGLLD